MRKHRTAHKLWGTTECVYDVREGITLVVHRHGWENLPSVQIPVYENQIYSGIKFKCAGVSSRDWRTTDLYRVDYE